MARRAAAPPPPEPAPPRWPADQVERWPIERLIPYARNARTHNAAQVSQIAASIREWGWTMPVLVDEQGTIIAGHGRVLAGHQLQVEQVPVVVARGWSETQKRAYTLADNKLALNADWDAGMLKLEMLDLRNLGVDLGLTGFQDFEVKSLLAVGVEDPAKEWDGMPEHHQDDLTSYRSLVVHFADQEALDEFARLLGQDIPDKAPFIWFPPVERQNAHALVYASEP
jgi:hypothetical protein